MEDQSENNTLSQSRDFTWLADVCLQANAVADRASAYPVESQPAKGAHDSLHRDGPEASSKGKIEGADHANQSQISGTDI